MQILYNLPRREIRYWCFRLSTEALGGAPSTGIPDGLKEYFEALPWFSSWENFGITWDVKDDKPLEIIPLKQSLEKSWNAELAHLARDLPTK
jgi:hypothetical protein